MNRIKFLSVAIISVCLFFAGCKSDSTVENQISKSLKEMYQDAIKDAMVADSSEIVTTLTRITNENSTLIWKDSNKEYLLVATFTRFPSSYPIGDTITTWWDNTWVTVVPELKEKINYENVSSENLLLRTEQLLGLPNNSGNYLIVEIWVKPMDLIRPAYETDISSNSSGLFFPDSISQDYINWFNGNIVYSYFPGKNKNGYPWTRLGYTYDWGNKASEVGLSEYLIKKNSQVIVHNAKNYDLYILGK